MTATQPPLPPQPLPSAKWRATQWAIIAAAAALPAPALILRLAGLHASPLTGALLFGMAILGAAFLLAWAAEVAQRDIPRALALTLLALIAVLPEYAVDAYLAWRAAGDPAGYGPLALVNMTGANRLLVGVAWPLVALLYWLRSRQLGRPAQGGHAVTIDREQGVEVAFLGLATLYSFVLPLKGTLSLIDMVVLVTLFGFYAARVMRGSHLEPDLVGPARLLGDLRDGPRRAVMAALFCLSAAVIFLVAEPFAEHLIDAGESLGLDRRTLVQWLAPLASEAPEFLITAIFASRLLGAASLGALVSSKVNQWTLLVSTIPLVFNIASWKLGKAVPVALALDTEQRLDLLLTSAQSLFAVSILLGLRLTLRDAGLLFCLFAAQFLLPESRLWIIGAYLALSLFFFWRNRPQIALLVGDLRGGDKAEVAPALDGP